MRGSSGCSRRKRRSHHTADLAITLGRPQKSISDLRDDLIREGKVYVPQRGELALTVPVFGPYLLNNYEQSRKTATVNLLGLEEMQRNVEAIGNVRRLQAFPQATRRLSQAL